jgi:hypothetical protein
MYRWQGRGAIGGIVDAPCQAKADRRALAAPAFYVAERLAIINPQL